MFTTAWILAALAAPAPVTGAIVDPPGAVDTGSLQVGDGADQPAPVVNGSPVPAGRWPDAAFVFGSGSCTGTLIAPRWVVTAAHCVPGMRYVLLNSNSNAVAYAPDSRLGDAERIQVKREYIQPSSSRDGYDYDIALLELVEPAVRATPRLIAQDCIVDEDLKKGSKVDIVGWGATRADGNGFTDVLLQGRTFVQTPDCSAAQVAGMASGCNPKIAPGGEIGAGGNGTDACFGDSGGPLYLPTDRGTFLIGVTSRSYIGASPAFPCRDGGIYTRPDASLKWMEKIMGEALPHPTCGDAPAPTADPIHASPSGRGRTTVLPNDPDGGEHTYVIVSGPEHGTATVDADGVVTYTPDDDFLGEDSVTVQVTDDGTPRWPDAASASGLVVVPVSVSACGCAMNGTTSSVWSLAFTLLLLRRRRV